MTSLQHPEANIHYGGLVLTSDFQMQNKTFVNKDSITSSSLPSWPFSSLLISCWFVRWWSKILLDQENI